MQMGAENRRRDGESLRETLRNGMMQQTRHGAGDHSCGIQTETQGAREVAFDAPK